jgi:phage anti-repressor protein
MTSFPDYLKKYSTISNKFIDDFFGIHDYKIMENSIYIDFDLVVKWLQSSRSHLKSTLTNTYIENMDYRITKKLSTGGRPSEVITLSYNCFRRLCLLSRTKKAEEVRSYFIGIEKHLNKYKDDIIDALKNRIGILNNNQKPKIKPKSGVIYVMKTALDIESVYKIGKSKNFTNRLSTHNSSHVDDVNIMLVYETLDIDAVENCLKSILKNHAYRKKKEFYKVEIDVLKELISGCDNLTLISKSSSKQKLKGGMFLYIAPN